MLRAYFDDSGTHQGAPVLVIAGLVGKDEQWQCFTAAWDALLSNPCPETNRPALKAFHLTDCRGGYGEFEGYCQAEIDSVTRSFRRVIMDNNLLSVAVAVNMGAWRELVVDKERRHVGHPVELCFVKCLGLLDEILSHNQIPDRVDSWFDAGVKKHLSGWATYYGSLGAKCPRVNHVGFAAVKNVVALQGADMIATETYHYAQLWLKHGTNARREASAHFQEYLREHVQLSTAIFLDKEHIKELVESYRALVLQRAKPKPWRWS